MKTPPKWETLPASIRGDVIDLMRDHMIGWAECGQPEFGNAIRAAIALLRSASKKKVVQVTAPLPRRAR